MGRGVAFTVSEDLFILEHAETKTAKQLYDLHQDLRKSKLWPERSIKSIARRVERLREDHKIDVRTDETRRKAYYERGQKIRGG